MRHKFYQSVLLIILIVLSTPTISTSANHDSLRVAFGTTLVYEVNYSVFWTNEDSQNYFEYYELLPSDNKIQSQDSKLILGSNSKQDFDANFYDTNNFLLFNYTRSFGNSFENFTIPNLSNNLYLPGEVVVIADWEFFSNFETAYEYEILEDNVRLILIIYEVQLFDNGVLIDIITLKDQSDEDKNSTNTIRIWKDIEAFYDKDTGVLKRLKIIKSKLDHSGRLLREEHYSKDLTESKIITYDIQKHRNLFSIDKIIAYSLLFVVLSFSIYLERKKWD